MTGWRAQVTEPVPALTVRAEAWRRIGPIHLEPVVPERDALVLHEWLTRSSAWGPAGLGLDEVLAYQQRVAASADERAWLGRVGGEPRFVVETYDPARVLLAGRYRARPGDVGMHLFVPPPDGRPRHGLTDAVMAATMRFCFRTLVASRVVVEPDVGNTAIAAKNAAAGFRRLREIDLAGRRAVLSVCTPDDFAASRLGPVAHRRAG